MSEACVIAVCNSFEIARDAVQELEDSNFPPEQISLVTHHTQQLPIQRPAADDKIQTEMQTERRTVAGAGVGGILGTLLGTPLVHVGGIGAVLVAGPIAAGLAGAAIGGILGALSIWGVHDDQIRHLNEELAGGAILVIANGSATQLEQAERVLRQSEANEVQACQG